MLSEFHIKLTILAALGISVIYLASGAYHTLVPVDENLQSRKQTTIAGDFIAYHVAAEEALRGNGALLYEQAAFDQAMKDARAGDVRYSWSYPPVFLLFVAPLGVLPFIPAFVAWSAALFGLSAWTLYRAAPHPLTPILAVFSPPLIHNFLAGQNGSLTAAILAGGLVLLPRHQVLAGLLFSLAVYKPHLALLVPVCLIAAAQYRALAAMTAGILLLVSVSTAVFGVGAWQGFLFHLQEHMGHVTAGALPIDRMPTVYGAALRMTGNDVAATFVQGVAGLVAVAGVAWTWWRTTGGTERATVLAAATLLATPYSFDYDLAILAIPLIWIGRDYAASRAPRLGPAVLAAIWLSPAIAFLVDAAVVGLMVTMLFGYGVWLTYSRDAADATIGERGRSLQ